MKPENVPPQLGECLDRVFAIFDASPLYFGHGTDSAWDEAVQLVLQAAELPLDSGDEVLGNVLDDLQRQRIARWTQRRVEERIPLPYLTGSAWFAGLPFHCDARALVPRSPLGELIARDYQPWWAGAAPRRILDLCCGGGSIGIAAARYNELCEVVLTDISDEALELARENVALHEVGDRVTVVQGDLFGGLGDERFDLILTNPPYVDGGDLASMPAEYLAEPPLGLGSGADGLDLSRRILSEAGTYLHEHGMLFLEVGNSWAALDELLRDQALSWVSFESGGHGVLAASAGELPSIRAGLAVIPHS